MTVATSILAGVLGVILRFQFAAEAAGFKVHAIGVTLMVASVVGFSAFCWQKLVRVERRVQGAPAGAS